MTTKTIIVCCILCIISIPVFIIIRFVLNNEFVSLLYNEKDHMLLI
jgi:hypothetical protein